MLTLKHLSGITALVLLTACGRFAKEDADKEPLHLTENGDQVADDGVPAANIVMDYGLIKNELVIARTASNGDKISETIKKYNAQGLEIEATETDVKGVLLSRSTKTYNGSWQPVESTRTTTSNGRNPSTATSTYEYSPSGMLLKETTTRTGSAYTSTYKYNEQDLLIESTHQSTGSYRSTSVTQYDWGSLQMVNTYTSDYSVKTTTARYSTFSPLPGSGFVLTSGLLSEDSQDKVTSSGKISKKLTTCTRGGQINSCTGKTTDETGADAGTSESRAAVSTLSMINAPSGHPFAGVTVTIDHSMSSTSTSKDSGGKLSTNSSSYRYNQIGSTVLSDYSYSYEGSPGRNSSTKIISTFDSSGINYVTSEHQGTGSGASNYTDSFSY